MSGGRAGSEENTVLGLKGKIKKKIYKLNRKKYDLLAKIALLVVAIVWGSSLVVVKSYTDAISPNLLLGSRFTIGCVTLSIIFHKNWQILIKKHSSWND